VLGNVTSASGGDETSDLALATLMATTSAGSLGLDEKSGLLWQGLSDVTELQRLLTDRPALAVRAREILDEAYADALALMARRTAAICKLAAVLLEKRALDGKEAEALIATCPADPSAAVPL
jgi:ATP-dependent Zn protease